MESSTSINLGSAQATAQTTSYPAPYCMRCHCYHYGCCSGTTYYWPVYYAQPSRDIELTEEESEALRLAAHENEYLREWVEKNRRRFVVAFDWDRLRRDG